MLSSLPVRQCALIVLFLILFLASCAQPAGGNANTPPAPVCATTSDGQTTIPGWESLASPEGVTYIPTGFTNSNTLFFQLVAPNNNYNAQRFLSS